MENNKTKELTPEQKALLRKDLPAEAISQHPTKTFLSTIKAIYVVERINEVFGIGSWKLKSTLIEKDGKMVVVQSFLSIPEYGIELESFGGNDNSDLGDAYKGATTDALTKIASMLEIGMNVFKGLSTPQTSKAASSDNKVTDWLSEDQFNAAMKATKGGILATLKAYNGQSGKGMKKEYLAKLTEQLSHAPSELKPA